MKTCKLCGNQFAKLCEAHVIPDFMYREHGIFNDQHQTALLRIAGERLHTGYRPTGEYDSDILCSNCDGTTIGQYETYARDILYNPSASVLAVDKGASLLYSNIDYTKFKIFLLSLLWRASITSREFFGQVKLDSADELKIRDMILSGNPGLQLDYPCVVWSHAYMDDVIKDYIISPAWKPLNGGKGYYFPIGGSIYIFFVPSYNDPTVKTCAINEAGQMEWIKIRTREEIQNLTGLEIPLKV